MKIRAADILNVRTLFAFLSEPLKPLNPLKTNAMKPNSTQPFNRITSQLLKVLLLLGVGLFLGQSALAQSTYTWTGGSATSGNWNDAANWGGSLPASPQGYLNFTNTTRINNTNNFAAGSSGFQIYFKAGASSGPFNLYGNSITFYNYGAVDPNIQNEGTNIQTINFPIVDGNGTANSPYGILNVNLNASPGQGPLVFNGTISALDATVAVRALNVSGSNTVTFNGVISDFSSSGKIALSQLGTGKTILTAANTYSGGTTVSGGTLQIGGAGKLNSGSYAGAISIASGATLECSGTNSQTLSGAISGSGVFVKDGALKSDLTLSSTLNTFSGITTITNGRIFVSSQGNLGGGGTIVQTNQGQLYIGAATTLTNSMNLSSIGYPEADALNNFDGAIRSDAASTLAGTITLSGNARIGNYNASGVTFTLSGQITGAYGIEFYGMNGGNNNNRIFLLSNTGNNYAGNTTISCNDFTSARTGCSTILQLGASGVIPDGNGDGNVVFNGADANHLTILEMNGLNETINGLSNVSATGAIIRNTTTGTSMLTIGNANTNSTFSGGITDGGATKSLGITKIGNGTLTLSGASSFVGPTIINAGTLILSGTNTTSGLTTVSAGELIFPIGNTYPNTFASTITVAGAGATNGVLLYSPGSQWVSTGNLTNQTSSVLHVNYSSFSPSTTLAPVKVANLSLGSTLTLRVDGSSSVFYSGQSYPLVTWTASGPANAAGFSTLVLPTGVSGNLSVSGSTLYLNVTANSSQLTWNTGSGNWDTSTANWLSNGIAASYVDGTSAVVFDDAVSASGNPVITNTSAWSPTGVLMKSTSHNYTIGGGAIAGSTSLILDPANTMTLTLTNVNTFTGGTTIAGGTLAIGGAGSLGSGSYAGAIANNGALTYNSSASQTLSGIIQGTGALNYMGAGGLTLSGANTYSGGTTLTNGIVVPGNGSAFGTGTVTANSGVTVYPVASMTIPNAVVLNGGNWRIGGGASHQLSASGAFSVTASSSILADGSTGYGVSGQTGGNWGSAIFLNGALNMGSTTNTLSISGQNGVTINGSVSGTNGTINNYNGGTYLWLANASNPFSGTLRAGGGYIILGYSGANSVYFATLDMNAADAGAFYIANYPLTVGGLMGSRNLTLGGAISIGVNGGSTTYSGNLTNSGSVTKIGTGTLTLSGAVNSTNGVMVGAGTLALSGSASIANANIIVANKAIFDVSALSAAFALGSTQVLTNSTTGAIISGTNNCTVGTLSLVYDGVTPSFIQTNGGMTLSASTAIKINNTAAQLPAGTRILIAAAQSGAKGLVAGALPTPTISGGGAAGAVSLKIDTFGNLDLVVAGTVEEWTGTSSTSWGTPGNWITGVIPGNGSNVVFDAQSTNNLATVLDTGYNLSSLSLYPTPAGAVSIGGTSTLTITNGITLSSGLGQNLTITAPLALGAAQTWMVTNLNTLIVSNVSGSGALTLAGGGTVVMNGANSTTGNNILNGGTTFRATANSAFPSSGTFYVLNNATPSGAGTIDLNGGTVTSTAYVPFMYSTTTILTNGTLIDNAAYTTAGDTHEDYNFMGTINLAPNGNYISNRRFVIGLNSVWIGFTTTINSLNNSTNGSLTWGGDNAGQMNYVGVTAGVAPTLNINGGTVNFNNATVGTGNGYLCIGCNSTTSKGTINLNGANLNAGTWIKMGGNYNAITGQSGTAILTIANGAVGIGGGSDTVYNGVLFMDGGNGDATANTGTSTLSITNATLTVAQIQAGNNGTKTINLNGAIINAGLGASNLFMSAALTVNLQSGGAAFNSGANSIIIGSALGSTGGLTKTGSGLLTLTNANTYSGLTTINLGELKFSTVGSGASTITTAGSATNGVLVASAGGQWVTTGSLTNQTSSTLHIDYNSTTPSTTTAPLKVASFVPGTGLTMLVSGGAFTAGQNYPLVTWTGSGPSNTNAFTALVLPHGAGYLSVSGSTLYLNVTASTEPLTWNTGNGNWDTSTANWVDSTLASSAYIDGLDQVVFDDATGATGNPSVTLNSTLSPASVTIKSTSHNYTIGGTGGIGGSTSLTLDPANTKTLILATTNTYTGSTTIGGGKLLITGTLGSGNYAGAIAISNSASLEYSNALPRPLVAQSPALAR